MQAVKLSSRLLEVVQALPLRKGVRVLEIGCGSGMAARAIVQMTPGSFVLGIDRSSKSITQARKTGAQEIAAGRLDFQCVAIEDFRLTEDTPLFDIAFAIRVGAFDGRHPEIGKEALRSVARALKKNGRFFIDGGDPLKEIAVAAFR